MQIAEYLVNLSRDPTQYFALGNKMKQISEMRDYIKLGKEAKNVLLNTLVELQDYTAVVMNK